MVAGTGTTIATVLVEQALDLLEQRFRHAALLLTVEYFVTKPDLADVDRVAE